MRDNKRFDDDTRGRKVSTRKEYRKVVSNFPSQFYFADLIDWSKKEGIVNDVWKKDNKNFMYILVLVDTFSRYCWMINIKDKRHEEVGKAFEQIFDKNVFNVAEGVDEVTLPEKVQTIPKCLVTDGGTEFCSKVMEDYYKYNNIKHIVLQGASKAMIAERVIQDYKMFIRNKWDGKKWYIWTNKFTEFYNNKYHSVIKDTPHNIFIEGNLPANIKPVEKQIKEVFNVGDIVSIRVDKAVLSKRSLKNNWTDSIYTIVEVDKRYYPVMYKVKNNQTGKILSRKYYAWELKMN